MQLFTMQPVATAEAILLLLLLMQTYEILSAVTIDQVTTPG